MHVIERTDRFTLVGADARRGKLTLFAAEGPREHGPLEHVALRVTDLGAALGGAPRRARARPGARARRTSTSHEGLSPRARRGGDGCRVRPRPRRALARADPAETARPTQPLGFARPPGRRGAPRVEVGGAFVEFQRRAPGEPERPLLNHLAVLVDSADEGRARRRRGQEVADVVDAPNTYAIFVWGPEGVKLEYVEHKPTFALK